MQPKKNPKADLSRDSGLFFVIGLTIVLSLTWWALELKTYTTSKEISIRLETIDVLDEDVPLIETIKPELPPPPPTAPDVIEIIEDIMEIEETLIQSTETSQEMEIEEVIAVEDVAVGEVDEDITVPFSVIENIPIFPGCEKGTKKEQKSCFQMMIQNHIRDNFRYPEMAHEMGIHGKVHVQFVIEKNGAIGKIRSRGPDKLLEEEAERIISLLPRMIPGKQRGRPVNVPYSIPISFKII